MLRRALLAIALAAVVVAALHSTAPPQAASSATASASVGDLADDAVALVPGRATLAPLALALLAVVCAPRVTAASCRFLPTRGRAPPPS